MSSEVEVYSLRGGSVPSAMTRRKRDPDNASTVPGGEPALLVVALPTHRLLLLALGHPALPRQAQNVGVAAEDRTMLHGGEHPRGSLQPPWIKKIYPEGVSWVLRRRSRYLYEVTGSVSDVRQRQRCIVSALFLPRLSG